MEQPALAQAGAVRVQAAKAHLQSLRTWRYENNPPTATTFDEVRGSAATCSTKGDTGQPWQTHCRCGRGKELCPQATTGACNGSEGRTKRQTGPSCLDTEARQNGTAPARYPHTARPRGANASALCAGTRMGGSLRAKLIRVPPRTLRPRRDRSSIRRS